MTNIFANNRKTNSVAYSKVKPGNATLDAWAGQNLGSNGEVAPQIDAKLGVFYRTQDGFARSNQGRGGVEVNN